MRPVEAIRNLKGMERAAAGKRYIKPAMIVDLGWLGWTSMERELRSPTVGLARQALDGGLMYGVTGFLSRPAV